jgi:PAS domain S-box-containing protein
MVNSPVITPLYHHQYHRLRGNDPIGTLVLAGDSLLIQTANQAAADYLRQPLARLVQQAFFSIVDGQESAACKTLLQYVSSTGTAHAGTYIPLVLTGPGTYSLPAVDMVCEPVADPEGTLNQVLISFVPSVDAGTEQDTASLLQQLVLSESKYRGLFEKMDQGFCIIEMIFNGAGKAVDYLFVESNPVFAQQTGLMNAVGKTALELVPNLEERWFNIYGKVATTGEPARFIEGSEEMGRWFEVYAFRLENDNNRKVALLFSDITGRKQDETALAASEERFRKAFANAAVGMAIKDQQGRYLHVNRAYENLVGYSLEELQQRSFHDITHPDDRQHNEAEMAQLLDGSSADFVTEKRYIRKDGQTVWVQISISLTRDSEGSPVNIIGLAEDITQKKSALEKIRQSEATFRTLSNTLPQLVWMSDKNGKLEFNSRQWKYYTGVEEQLDEALWDSLVHPDDRIAFLRTWIQSIENPASFKHDLRLRHHSGEYRWNNAAASPIRDEAGHVLKWVGAYTDIHEQKLQEIRKDEFISIASHEMRTPLTVAKGYIELLESAINNTELLLYVQRTGDAVQRLNDLVAELLDVSKIQNGKLQLTLSAFNIETLVKDTAEIMQQTTPQHRITISGTIQQPIMGDPHRLGQVLINMLSNAAKYSPSGKQIEVLLTETADWVTVAVKDHGIGIGQQHLEKIFDRYYRVEENELHFPGLGIGLYISKSIIERHNGNMWAESSPGEGSIFYFSIKPVTLP